MKGKIGLAPGSLIYIGEKRKTDTVVSFLKYNSEEVIVDTVSDISKGLKWNNSTHNIWINVYGLENVETIKQIGNQFNLHPLLLEDVLNTHHRTKIEEFDSYIFVNLKTLHYDKDGDMKSSQISFVLGEGYIIAFHEQKTDLFDPINRRFDNNLGRLRTRGTDYLLYALIDIVVDSYFVTLEKISNYIDDLEEQITTDSNETHLAQIHANKRELIHLRKIIYPLRESISKLEKEDSSFIEPRTSKYYGDIYDHTVQLAETLDSCKELNASLKDMYMSSISLKMNQVMQVLTIIATIFIPLTFIAGIYGMNFDYMPELRWQYGYFVIWGVMGFVSLLLIAFFRKKKWI